MTHLLLGRIRKSRTPYHVAQAQKRFRGRRRTRWSGRLGSGSRTANPVLVDHSSRSHCIGTDFFVRADGVDAATCGNGDFGTSPFYGQTQMSDARNSASRHATITAPFPKTQPTSTSAGMLFFWTTNWVPMPYQAISLSGSKPLRYQDNRLILRTVDHQLVLGRLHDRQASCP